MSGNISVTLKLYASLGAYLPPASERNSAILEADPGTTIQGLLDAQSIPREACHLVLLNGVFQPIDTRASATLKDGDAVAVWPPVAGG